MSEYHIPVLLKESVESLNIKPSGVYVDVTFGGGGHSAEILKHLNTGKLFGFDKDADASANVIEDSRFVFVRQDYKYITNFLKFYGIVKVDGILADLGISSHQIDTQERGFSIRYNSFIDLRMDKDNPITGRDVLNNYSEDDLKKIFAEYGELQNPGKIAKYIVNARTEKSIDTTNDIKDVFKNLINSWTENKFFAKLFQALRIEVNKELDSLKQLLLQAEGLLNPGGRLVVISYHSLEDRLVKSFTKTGKFEGEVDKDFYGNPLVKFKLITRKVIIPNDNEIEMNARSRSAKLRVAEKL